MRTPQRTTACLAAAVIVVAVGCHRAPETLSPEAARAKGDELLREMSTRLAGMQAFAYTVNEHREIVSRTGQKSMRESKRRVLIRRPNAFAFTGEGAAGQTAGWYDGHYITIVGDRDKVWARGPMPPTLDEALDYLASEYDLRVASADLLYSSPYDALMTKDTTGGWVGVEKVGEASCDHLAYAQEVVDWEIWLGAERRLPCQFKITYKKDPGQPTTTMTYSPLETPQISDDSFTPKVPADYHRIKIMRHGTVADASVQQTPAPTSQPAAPRP